jgi:hypothetical protein
MLECRPLLVVRFSCNTRIAPQALTSAFRLCLLNLLVLRIYSLSSIRSGTPEISMPSRTTSMLRSESQTHRLRRALVDTSRCSLHLWRGAIFRLQAYKRSTRHLIWINWSSFGCGSTGASFLRVTCSITMVADLAYPQVPFPFSVSRLL